MVDLEYEPEDDGKMPDQEEKITGRRQTLSMRSDAESTVGEDQLTLSWGLLTHKVPTQLVRSTQQWLSCLSHIGEREL